MNEIAERIAAWQLVADGYFGVGEEILFGKYKNKRGKIVAFGQDDRGIPTVEIEPVPKGRKQNQTLGLYKIWKVPAARTKEACIIAGRKFGDRLCLLKNRDRAYDPELQVVRLDKDGTEVAAVLDLNTGYIEGVNEHGIAIVNTTLMVVRDEQEGVKTVKTKGQKGPKKSKDGPKIFAALGADTLEEAIESLVSYKGGIRGHTFVTDGKRLVCIECTRTHPARIHELDPERVNTRTNHGVNYPDAGYTHGEDYISSIVRRWEAQKRLKDVRRPETIAPALMPAIDTADSPYNPARVTDKMRTTSQLTVDATNPALYLYLIPGHAELKPTRNLLPKGRKPKIPVRVFRYRDNLEDRETVKKQAKGRYKSKKKVKTKDGDEMVVYEYSDRQVADRNRQKAERIEKLRTSMKNLQTKVRKDVQSKDEKVRDVALAVGLMDETFERVGNDGSAKDGHFGVTTWRVKHVKFGNGGVTISYVGKSGVDQKKKITNPRIVSGLKKACKDKKPEDCVLSVSASEVNKYLKGLGITAKDIRGFHANTEMKTQLKKVRKGKLPTDPKEKEKKLKAEFDKALAATAERVGHEASTLKSQYLVPGLEDDYKRDGTVNESHTKKGAEAVTDTASFYVLAPEALKGMIDDTNWLELAHDLWPGSGQMPKADVGNLVQKMEREVQESGGAVLNTGWDGGFDVGIKGKYNDDGQVESFELPVREKGATPPYGLRQAAEQGTKTERRILSNAIHAPTIIIRDRGWWLEKAPNIYRFARQHERPRPTVAGLQFDPQIFSVLWYEDVNGNRLDVLLPTDSTIPKDAKYQRSQFPSYLHDSMLALNEDGTSTEVLKGERGFPPDLVTAMVRSEDWDVADAIMVAGQSCERCMNVLGSHYGLDWGYKFGSDEYWRCGTSCEMCEHIEDSEESDELRLGTKSDAEKEEEAVQKMLRKEPKKKPPRYDLRDNRTLDEDDEEDLGGGDGGDRDLSLKWNKVGMARRIAFQWLATPRGISGARLAMMYQADVGPQKPPAEGDQPKPKQEAPSFDEWVKEKRWPSKAENAPPGAEVGFEGLKKQDPGAAQKVREEYKRQFPGAGDEEGKKKEKGEEEEERTYETIDADLNEARDNAEELKDTVSQLGRDISESEKKIKQLKEKLKRPPEEPGAARAQKEQKVEQARRVLQEASEKRDALGTEIDDLTENSEEIKRAYSQSEARIKELQGQLEGPKGPGAEEQKGKVQGELDKAKAKVEGADSDLKKLDEDISKLEKHIDDEDRPLRELKKSVKEFEREIHRMEEGDLATVVPNVPELQEQLEERKKELEEARRELRSRTAGVQDAKKEIKAKEKASEKLRQGKREAEAEAEKLQEQLDAGFEEPESVDQDAINAEIRSERTKSREAKEKFDDVKKAIAAKTKERAQMRGAVKKGEALVEKLEAEMEAPEAEPEDHDQIKAELSEAKDKLREQEDELDEKKEEWGEAKQRVNDLKAERKDPTGAKKKREEAAKKERETKVKEAIERTTKTMETLLGKGTALSKQSQKEISAHLSGMDETQLEQFALDFENSLGDLTKQDPKSAEAVRLANGVAKNGFSTEGIKDPEELATRVAEIAYARNVVANPMITGGKPVGQTEMDDVRVQGARAKEAYEQFKELDGSLRRDAAGRIARELKGLNPDSHKAKELQAILSGMNTAHVVDTGDSLPGRPQPSKGSAALVRHMIEQGDVDQVFGTTDDFFADETQKAFEGALGAMSDEEMVDFTVGDDPKHPFAPLREVVLEWKGAPEYKEFLKNFLREDFMQKIWADRAFRDVMEANGNEDSDDPEVRAQMSEDAARENGKRREEGLQAMIRIQDAQERGEEPDEKDVELARRFDPEDGTVLRDEAGSVLDKIRGLGKKIVSPAVAVLNHFRNTGDADAKKTETLPHPDEKAKEPRPKEEREKAKLTRRELLTGPRAPKEEGSEKAPEKERSPKEIQKERVKLKAIRHKLKSQRSKVKPEERARYDERIKKLDQRIKGLEEAPKEKTKRPVRKLEKKHEKVRDLTDEELDNEAGEYFENEFTQAVLPGAFKDADDLKRRVKEAEVAHLDAEQLAEMENSDVGDILRAEDPAARARELAKKYDRDLGRVEQGISEGAEMPPAIVLKDKNGKLVLMGGNTRLMGGAAAGTAMPVKIVEVDSEFDEKAAEAMSQEESGEDKEHGPGDVWETEDGNWRAKNEDGAAESFDSREKADAYAKGKGKKEEGGVPKTAADKLAAEVADVWLAYVRSVHPDDPNRPIVFVDAA